MGLRKVLRSKSVTHEEESKLKESPKLISTTEEIRPCKQTGKSGKKKRVTIDRMHTKQVYSDRSVKWICSYCGRVSFDMFVPYTYRPKKDKPDWLKTWQKQT